MVVTALDSDNLKSISSKKVSILLYSSRSFSTLVIPTIVKRVSLITDTRAASNRLV